MRVSLNQSKGPLLPRREPTALRGRSRGPLVAALLVALLPSWTTVQAASKAQQAEIDALVNKAYELRRAGDDQAALKVLEQAVALERQPRVMAQKGMAEQALGLWPAAERDLGEGLAHADDPWVVRNRGTLDAAMNVIREHLASLDIWGPPPGAKVLLDGEVIGTVPLATPLRVPAANIDIVVQADSHAEMTRSFNLKPGTRTREHIVLRPLNGAPAMGATGATSPDAGPTTAQGNGAPSASPQGAQQPSHAWTVGLASGAAVSLAFGIWQHVSWRTAQGDFEKVDGCYASLPNHGTDSRCAGLYDTLTQHRTLTYVGYGAAGAFAIGAGVAAWFAASSTKPTEGHAATSSKPSTLAISFNPSSWGLALQGAF